MARNKRQEEKGQVAWKMLGTSSALLGGLLATKVLDTTWRKATGHNPPNKPEHPELKEREALLWAAVSGMLIGVAKAYATRRAANYWVKSFGQPPPGTEEDVYKPTSKESESSAA